MWEIHMHPLFSVKSYRINITLTLTVIVQDAVFAAALNSRCVRAPVAGCGRAAGPHRSVWDLTRGPEAVRLNARRVRAAVAGGGVPGQAFVVRHAPGAAAAGSAAFVQVVHVQFQSIADVWLPVLLLLCRAAQQRHNVWLGPTPLHLKMFEEKWRRYLRFPPSDGLVWERAAGSCRGDGCCWAAAGGDGSEPGSLCSRWVYGPRADHRGGFQTSSPARERENKHDYRAPWVTGDRKHVAVI